MEKMPPVEKIYEAWSAVADGRVTIDDAARKATVVSSDRTREYTVSWSDDGSVYNSNDNATYWRGYAGYPVIAVMMMQGRLPSTVLKRSGMPMSTGRRSTPNITTIIQRLSPKLRLCATLTRA